MWSFHLNDMVYDGNQQHNSPVRGSYQEPLNGPLTCSITWHHLKFLHLHSWEFFQSMMICVDNMISQLYHHTHGHELDVDIQGSAVLEP